LCSFIAAAGVLFPDHIIILCFLRHRRVDGDRDRMGDDDLDTGDCKLFFSFWMFFVLAW
jgi:hypothetical protein